MKGPNFNVKLATKGVCLPLWCYLFGINYTHDKQGFVLRKMEAAFGESRSTFLYLASAYIAFRLKKIISFTAKPYCQSFFVPAVFPPTQNEAILPAKKHKNVPESSFFSWGF